MFNTIYLSTITTFSYFDINTACLIYGTQLTSSKSLILMAYFDLIVDLAEAFGVWTTIALLILTTLTSVVVVQQVINSNWNLAKFGKSTSAQGSSLKLVTYQTLTRLTTVPKLR